MLCADVMLVITKPFANLVLIVSAVLLDLISYGSTQTLNEPCTNPRGESGRCVLLRECRPLFDIYKTPQVSLLESRFFYDSICSGKSNGKPLVCCSTPPSGSKELPRPPADCGLDLPDRIHGGEEARLGEFSWMALLVYINLKGKQSTNCGASLINSRYVVTAAHCVVGIAGNKTLVGVRLGEHNITNHEQDCDRMTCADIPVDVGIEKVIVSEEYGPPTKGHYNDIALIRLDRDVQFSDFINPICLPLEASVRQMSHTGKKAIAAGWGITQYNKISEVKLKVTLDVVDLGACREAGLWYKNLRNTQICAGGKEGEDTCRGDSGGPLMRRIQGNYYLIGVVSYGPTNCGTEDVPGVYTNVPMFVDWIQRNLE